MTPRFTYREIPPWHVPADTRHRAELALRLATAHLKVGECALRWFLRDEDVPHPTPLPGFRTFESDEPDLLGMVREAAPDSVWIRGDVSPHRVTEVIAHELAHTRQYLQGSTSIGDADVMELHEIQAAVFGGRFSAVLRGDQ